MNAKAGRIQTWLAGNVWVLNSWAMTAAFTTYFFMYMFRKPFTVAAFAPVEGEVWHGKAVLVSSQVLGYLCSKLIGIRVISQMPAGRRATVLLSLILLSELALLLFACLPAPWHVGAIFLNGLPLGMVFGLVLGFLEGRRLTEILVAGLCASFILAGGFAKSMGQWTLNFLIDQPGWDLATAERWMPSCVGLLFLLPIAISTWMLAQIPYHSEADLLLRSERTPMSSQDRWSMLRQYGFVLAAISIFYLLVTILRSIRDDFAPQILKGMQADVAAGDYSWIDSQVALFVLVVNGATALVTGNRRAIQVSLAIALAGFAMVGLALGVSDRLSPLMFMVVVGAGMYLPYVAVHTTLFERLIALTRDRGNIAFLMYVVDSIGYLGYVVILFLPPGTVNETNSADTNFYFDFRWYCLLVSISGGALSLIAWYFVNRLQGSPAHRERAESL